APPGRTGRRAAIGGPGVRTGRRAYDARLGRRALRGRVLAFLVHFLVHFRVPFPVRRALGRGSAPSGRSCA
ncbi:hypothetical protein, partial [Streptomyces sp. CBMA29]|uniref:hypothetical protein n=1 Tax=Streptomyces sp. CBMA29 TaxID=1896314 RepID=UPI001CB6C68A